MDSLLSDTVEVPSSFGCLSATELSTMNLPAQSCSESLCPSSCHRE